MSGPIATLYDAVQDRFNTQIASGGDGGAAIPTLFGNDATEQPKTGTWCRVTIRFARDRAETGESAGSVRSRSIGVMFVEVYSEQKRGTLAPLAVVDRIVAAFDSKTHAGVTYRTPTPLGDVTPRRFGKWALVTLSCPFFADDLT